MSSVRMCDRCGEIFSERAENWSTFTGATRKKDEKGNWTMQSDTLDSCPDCTDLMTAPPAPRPVPALGAGVAHRYEPEPQSGNSPPAQ